MPPSPFVSSLVETPRAASASLDVARDERNGWALRFLIAFLLLLCVWAPVHAQTFPKPNNTRVVDAANLIAPAEETALDAKLAAYEKETGRQMVVATIPSLEGYPIEDYGYRLGRTWGIGSKDKDDGTLLIVAPNDRKVRIEVGYGLEPYMTDAFSSVIINTQILPRFKAGDFVGGINAGTDAMIAQLKLTPEAAAARLKEAEATQADKGGGIPVALIFWMIVLFFVILPAMRRGKGGRRHRGMGPVVIWGPGDWGGGSGGGWGGGGGGFDGFSGGGGGFGGGGSSGSW